MITGQALRADKVLSIVLKVVQEDFGNTRKKSHWLHLPFFFTIFLRLGEVVPLKDGRLFEGWAIIWGGA